MQLSRAKAYTDCIFRALPQMDDGKSDPLSIAVGVAPRCAPEWNALSQLMIDTMTTEKSQDYMRAQMQSHEIQLATSAVLAYRASKQSRAKREP